MKTKTFNIREFFATAKLMGGEMMMSPLKRYVVYSAALHAVLVGALSIGMVMPAKAKAEPAKAATTAAQPAPAAGAATSTTLVGSKPTGKGEDYYKREGIDTTPAGKDEIPKNPFDAKDNSTKSLGDLK